MHHGRFWTNYQPIPSVTASSSGFDWGAEFAELDYCADGGEWDVENTSIHFASTVGMSEQYLGPTGRAFHAIQPSSALKLPGQRCVGGWRGAMVMRHLLISPAQFASFVGAEYRYGCLHDYDFARVGDGEPTNRVVDHILQALADDLSEDSPAGPVFAQTAISALLARLLGPQAEFRGSHFGRDRRLQRALENIHANLGGKLTLLGIARDMDVSVQYLCRVFKRELGLTPYQYIIRERVSLARELIQHSELSLSQIALRSGFNDQSQMSTRIRAALGVSPSQLRQVSEPHPRLNSETGV